MKVVFCHTDLRLYWSKRLAALAAFLQKYNVEMWVVEIAGKGSPYAFAHKSDPLACKSICLFPDRGMENLPPCVAAARVFQEFDHLSPDMVVAGAIAYPSGITAVRWARARRRPVVIMDDARVLDVPRPRFINWVKKRIYRNVDAVFIPAFSHASDYQFWGIPSERIFFGVDVVDNQFFAENALVAQRNATTIRKQYGLPSRYILGVGRQVPEKNWGILIQAFSKVCVGANQEWGLVLVGDGPEATSLRQLGAQVRGNLRFLPFQSQGGLSALYGLAECLVLPSYGETWGLVVNEAMACGLPVMVSKECGCAETLVRDGYNGWVFDPQSPAELTALLRRFMNIPEKEKMQMGVRSREIIADWGIERFCSGAWAAIQACAGVKRSFVSLMDRAILALWKGRYRPI